jgi:8-oxo-dGTP pyrophosphatase MutT (NUDIX family)
VIPREKAEGIRPGFAPRQVFDEILRYAVIPTFDLALWFEGRGIFMARRRISPYQHKWALPGLRILKGEDIEDCLVRIAFEEVGIEIDPSEREFVGQESPQFTTDQDRQDLATCYSFDAGRQDPVPNEDHFSEWRYVQRGVDIPEPIGGVYRRFLSNII